MSYHDWGDTDFDWKGLNEAMLFIYDYVYFRSLCRAMMKEKYGSIRYEYVWPPGTSFRLGFQIELPVFKRKTRFGLLPIVIFNWSTCWLVQKWASLGWKLVLKAALIATKKWPHLKDEILEDLASNEELVGKELHDKYWRSA